MMREKDMKKPHASAQSMGQGVKKSYKYLRNTHGAYFFTYILQGKIKRFYFFFGEFCGFAIDQVFIQPLVKPLRSFFELIFNKMRYRDDFRHFFYLVFYQ